MEYQQITNLLDNTPNQPSKFRTKNWVEINDDSRELVALEALVVKLDLKFQC